jgi:hypothetical protein
MKNARFVPFIFLYVVLLTTFVFLRIGWTGLFFCLPMWAWLFGRIHRRIVIDRRNESQ